MAQLTYREASEAYEASMRNVLPAGPGVCATCKTFIDPIYPDCHACGHSPAWLDVVVPITYSEHLGQLHTALRNYKSDENPRVRRHAQIRLAGILWRFTRAHEECIAAAAGVERFPVVTTVPSSATARDQLGHLGTIASWCMPIRSRLRRVLRPTGRVPTGRTYDEDRYDAIEAIDDGSVLLIDDTWTSGGHAQSAAWSLRQAGATTVALVVIGRHVRSDWKISDGTTSGQRLTELPRRFDWGRCAVH